MNPRYFDLRFLIGLFFLLIGLVVVLASFGGSSVANGSQINLYSGLLFLGFAGIMLLSFRLGSKED